MDVDALGRRPDVDEERVTGGGRLSSPSVKTTRMRCLTPGEKRPSFEVGMSACSVDARP
jgi:hypothetical protein